MGFVNDDQVPIEVKYSVVLIEFTADTHGAAQILNRRKVEKIVTVFIEPPDFEIIFKVDLLIICVSGIICFQFKRIVMCGRSRIKDFCKIRAPPVADDRTMRDDNHTAVL